VIDLILEEEVTPELIILAQDASEDDWDGFQFLRVIGVGNPVSISRLACLFPFCLYPDSSTDLLISFVLFTQNSTRRSVSFLFAPFLSFGVNQICY
jgi:hypothetical protein